MILRSINLQKLQKSRVDSVVQVVKVFFLVLDQILSQLELLIEQPIHYDLICVNCDSFKKKLSSENSDVLKDPIKYGLFSKISENKFKLREKSYQIKSCFIRMLEGSWRHNGLDFVSGNIIAKGKDKEKGKVDGKNNKSDNSSKNEKIELEKELVLNDQSEACRKVIPRAILVRIDINKLLLIAKLFYFF